MAKSTIKATTVSMSRVAAVLCTISAICLLLSTSCAAFTAAPRIPRMKSGASILKLSQENQDADSNSKVELKSNNPLELAAWYGVEAFGKVFGKKNDNTQSNESTGDIDLTKTPSSLKETLARIQLDNDRSYFLSGEVDRLVYDENCVFADPFVSFNGKHDALIILVHIKIDSSTNNCISSGRDRFIDNLSNLGSFITNYSAKMISYDVNDDGSQINTKVSL